MVEVTSVKKLLFFVLGAFIPLALLLWEHTQSETGFMPTLLIGYFFLLGLTSGKFFQAGRSRLAVLLGIVAFAWASLWLYVVLHIMYSTYWVWNSNWSFDLQTEVSTVFQEQLNDLKRRAPRSWALFQLVNSVAVVFGAKSAELFPLRRRW